MDDGRTVVGIDVAWPRACTAVVLRDGRPVTESDWLETSSVADMVSWVVSLEPVAVGIDAPQGWNRRLLMPASRLRVCDRELLRRRINVSQVPAKPDVDEGRAKLPGRMAVGFECFHRLTRPSRGFEKAREDDLPGAFGRPPAVLEAYPHAAFATLLGGLPEPKTTRRGAHRRVVCLLEQGLKWGAYYDHDSLDALVAACTALRYVQGRASAMGNEREGLLWLPVPRSEVLERYETLR